MFVIRVTYLTGRVYSAEFDDGDSKVEPEWPPHPSRLYSALVSAWSEGGGEEELRPALEWIERQEPPTIHAGDCSVRRLVQAFVPVNDTVTLPEDRARKPRRFPSASLPDPDVYFVWNEVPTAEVLESLRRLLERTSALGHSASLVAAEIADAVPRMRLKVWHPGAAVGKRMRIPYPGRLNELMDSYRRFENDPSKVHRPSTGETTVYAEPKGTQTVFAHGVFGPMIVLRRDEGPRASLHSALSVVTALRKAMMSHAPEPMPEYLSGHAPGSTPEAPVRSEIPHVALIPLANIDSAHANGELMGVAALLPRTLTRKEQEICWQVFGGIDHLQMPWGRWLVSVADAEEHRHGLRPDRWNGPGSVWSTVTPFVFDRYPKEPFGAEAEQTVREAFVRVGLPEPLEIDLHYNPWHTGALKASGFPPALARAGKPQRYHCHVWARFGEPIQGPVVAGAGRYYGYGFFRPLTQRKEAR